MIAVVLAAGLGTRMKSTLPKVLHSVCGKPLIAWVVGAARAAGATRVIVVVSPQGEAVRAALPDCEFAVQQEPRGTGDALRCARERFKRERGPLLVLYGDTPLIDSALLKRLQRAQRKGPLALVTLRIRGRRGYGRIIREAGQVVRVVEEKDASPKQRAIDEGNAGLYLVDTTFLLRALGTLGPSSQTGEFYLTDIVARAAKAGAVATVDDEHDITMGVNGRKELALAQDRLRSRILDQHFEAGVRFENSNTTTVESDVTIGADSEIGAGVELRGNTAVGRGCKIGTGCIVNSSRIADQAVLLPYCVVTDSVIGSHARVGPFAHLRPGSDLGEHVHVGNFVETKKTRIDTGSKANHLSYLGDCDIGARVNIGAGTITCNYDGFAKHRTTIEDGVFVGSDTQFVAPVAIRKNAYIGAGSTITKDVPAGALALTRAPQKVVEGYVEQRKARAIVSYAKDSA